MARKNVPGNRTIPILDAKSKTVDKAQQVFRQFQKLGLIPKRFNSWDMLDRAALQLYAEGLSTDEVAQKLGVTGKNVIGSRYIELNEASGGGLRGVNKRAIREGFKPDEILYITKRYGKNFLADLGRLRKLEWGNVKGKPGEAEALKKKIYDSMDAGRLVGGGRSPNDPEFVSAKTEANAGRDRLHSAFGNGGKASEVHRGHGVSAVDGAGTSTKDLEKEWGLLNIGHGSDPRFDRAVMRSLNMSAGDLQALYDGYLTYRGIDINPYRYSGNYVKADENLRELKQGTTIGRPQITTPDQPTGISQDSIEARDRRLEELAQQRAVELEKDGLSARDALTKARKEMDNLSYQGSTLFDTTQSRGGPVRSSKIPEGYAMSFTKPATLAADESLREQASEAQRLINKFGGSEVTSIRSSIPQEIKTWFNKNKSVHPKNSYSDFLNYLDQKQSEQINAATPNDPLFDHNGLPKDWWNTATNYVNQKANSTPSRIFGSVPNTAVNKDSITVDEETYSDLKPKRVRANKSAVVAEPINQEFNKLSKKATVNPEIPKKIKPVKPKLNLNVGSPALEEELADGVAKIIQRAFS